MYPDTLDAFPYNIFAYVQPKLVIISTPNADFNVLFKKMGKFRHYDHKFEWSREQFEDWHENLKFPAKTNLTNSFVSGLRTASAASPIIL